jgi:uncharacterized protein (DUF952 family)
MTRIYKILTSPEWEAARQAGRFEGSTVDLADGFIHFSAAHQVQETARRYFRDQSDLVVLEVDANSLGPELVWEPSRGGDLFPHLYEPLRCSLVVATRAAPLGPDGVPNLGALAT